MPTRNVDLTDHFDRFIDNGITSGGFSNTSEVVREGLRLLEQREKESTDSIDRGEGIESFNTGPPRSPRDSDMEPGEVWT